MIISTACEADHELSPVQGGKGAEGEREGRRNRRKGVLVAIFGVVIVSPDAACVRFASNAGVARWQIIFWKMIFVSVLVVGYSIWDQGGPCHLLASIGRREARRHVLLGLLCQVGVNLGFTLSLTHLDAARTLLWVSLNPLWAALMGVTFLGDRLKCSTTASLMLSGVAIALIFVPRILGSDDQPSASSDLGHIIAFFTGIFLACYVTVVRHAGRFVEIPVNTAGAAAVGSVVAATTALTVLFATDVPLWPSSGTWEFLAVIAVDGFCVGGCFVCLNIAPKFVTGTETGLIFLLETVLGPLWVWIAFHDAPPLWTCIGGALLLSTLSAHEVANANSMPALPTPSLPAVSAGRELNMDKGQYEPQTHSASGRAAVQGGCSRYSSDLSANVQV